MSANLAINSERGKCSLKFDCSREQLMAYFKSVCKLVDETKSEFPVNLDDVWPIIYADKGKAVRALKDGFIEDIDYQRLPEMASEPKAISEGGSNKVTYFFLHNPIIY